MSNQVVFDTKAKWHQFCEEFYKDHPLLGDVFRDVEADNPDVERINLMLGYLSTDDRLGKEPVKVLDVGCQDGIVTDKLRKIGFDVVGVESVKRFYDQAVMRFPETPFVHGFVEEQGYEDEFDFVVMTETLEHVCNPEEVMRAVTKALKYQGMLYASVPLPVMGDYPTHWKIWGQYEFRKFIEKYLLVKDHITFKTWNVITAVKNTVVKDITMDEMMQVMKLSGGGN